MRFTLVLCTWICAGAVAGPPTPETMLRQHDYSALQAWLDARDEAGAADVETLYWEARMAMLHGAGEQAVELIEQALQLAPEAARLHSLHGSALALTLGGAGRMEQMRVARQLRQSFETAVALDPDDVEGRFGLLNYYAHAPRIAGGGPRRARAQADELARISPVEGALAEATLAGAASDPDGVLRALERALALDPRRDEARLTAGLVYVQQAQWDAARRHFLILVEQVPLHNAAIYQIGRVAALSGEQLEEGRAALEVFLERAHQPGTPGHAAAHWRLGMILAAQGDSVAAADQYRRALEMEPELEEAAQSLAALTACEDEPADSTSC